MLYMYVQGMRWLVADERRIHRDKNSFPNTHAACTLRVAVDALTSATLRHLFVSVAGEATSSALEIAVVMRVNLHELERDCTLSVCAPEELLFSSQLP